MKGFEFHGITDNTCVQTDHQDRRKHFINSSYPRHKANKKKGKRDKKLKKKIDELARRVGLLNQEVNDLRDREPNGFYVLRRR